MLLHYICMCVFFTLISIVQAWTYNCFLANTPFDTFLKISFVFFCIVIQHSYFSLTGHFFRFHICLLCTYFMSLANEEWPCVASGLFLIFYFSWPNNFRGHLFFSFLQIRTPTCCAFGKTSNLNLSSSFQFDSFHPV